MFVFKAFLIEWYIIIMCNRIYLCAYECAFMTYQYNFFIFFLIK